MSATFSSRNFTRTSLTSIPYELIKDSLLGRRFVISLVFVGDKKSQALNRIYRKKNYVPNVLAFPLARDEGEIYINPRKAAREAANFGMSRKTYLAYLFIHACLHLKGVRHGATMENIERRVLHRFKLSS